MTAAIVGWAHSPFGKLTGESVESLIVKVAADALADAGVRPGTSMKSCSATSTRLLAAKTYRHRWSCKLRPIFASSGRCGWRTLRDRVGAVHQAIKAIEARAARLVLVVGVEQMTTTPAQEIGRNLLKASYVREEAEIDGGFAGVFGNIAGLYFQKYGDQSDALAMIAAKNHKNGVGNPYAQIRRISVTTSAAPRATRTLCRRSLEADGLLSGFRRRRRRRDRRYRNRTEVEEGRRLSRGRTRAGLSADVEARHSKVRRLCGRLAARSGAFGPRAWRSVAG